MKIQYDPAVDMMYIYLARGKYDVSRELTEDVLVDVDSKGKVLGLEIYNTKQVAPGLVKKAKILKGKPTIIDSSKVKPTLAA